MYNNKAPWSSAPSATSPAGTAPSAVSPSTTMPGMGGAGTFPGTTAGTAMPGGMMMPGMMMPGSSMPGMMMPGMAPGSMVPMAQGGAIMPPVVPNNSVITPTGVTFPPLPKEESYVENILRMNLGKVGTFYMTYENNSEWNAKIFKGVVEAAGRDHIIISDPVTGKRYLLLTLNLDYITFDEPLTYNLPFGSGSTRFR